MSDPQGPSGGPADEAAASADSPSTAPMACAACGAVPDRPATALLTWSRGTEDRREVWTCDACSRRHLRSIEGKLDSRWW